VLSVHAGAGLFVVTIDRPEKLTPSPRAAVELATHSPAWFLETCGLCLLDRRRASAFRLLDTTRSGATSKQAALRIDRGECSRGVAVFFPNRSSRRDGPALAGCFGAGASVRRELLVTEPAGFPDLARLHSLRSIRRAAVLAPSNLPAISLHRRILQPDQARALGVGREVVEPKSLIAATARSPCRRASPEAAARPSARAPRTASATGCRFSRRAALAAPGPSSADEAPPRLSFRGLLALGRLAVAVPRSSVARHAPTIPSPVTMIATKTLTRTSVRSALMPWG